MYLRKSDLVYTTSPCHSQSDFLQRDTKNTATKTQFENTSLDIPSLPRESKGLWGGPKLPHVAWSRLCVLAAVEITA